jgi:hypothetical protein
MMMMLIKSVMSCNVFMFTAMVSVLDEAVGNVTDLLQKYGLYDDSLIIFHADVSNIYIYKLVIWVAAASMSSVYVRSSICVLTMFSIMILMYTSNDNLFANVQSIYVLGWIV